MDMLLSLWLPILLATVAVFIGSFITWAVLPFHHGEFKGLPDEEFFLNAFAQRNIGPGEYMFPFAGCSGERMKDPAFVEKMKSSPMGQLRVWPGMPNMGVNMALTILVFLILNTFVAYLASQTLPPGAGFSRVFQIAGTAAILGHAFGGLPNAIWFCKSARAVTLELVDCVIFALITGAIFAWLWPAAATPSIAVPAIGG